MPKWYNFLTMKKSASNNWSRLIKHERHTLTFGDVSIIVEDGVFTPNPKITQTPWMVIENFPDLKEKRVADVGTGSGIIAIMAVKQGAGQVVATDIEDKAIENAKENVIRNNVSDKVKVIKTDLLEGVDGTFDYIFANIPMKKGVWDKEGISVTSTPQQFIESAKSKLNQGGEIYIPWGSFAEETRVDLESVLKKNGLKFNLSIKELLGYTWYLYKIK